MSSLRTLLRAVLLGTFFAFSVAPSVAVKVEEIVVGPASAGGTFVLSPSGGRIAYVGMKGTRVVVKIDGVEGPVFDELYGPMGQSYFCPPQAVVARSTAGGQGADPMTPVIFSPDGAHYAYAGRQGGEYVVIHDGREIARGPRQALSLNYGFLTLSPTGRQVHFVEMDQAGARAKWRLVMTGKPGPWSSNNNGLQPVFSADGTRYAYNAASETDVGKTILVVDGKDAGYVGMDPVFTADGKSLLSISVPTAAAPKQSVLVDGKPAITALGVDKLIAAPVGRRWGAIVRTKLVGATQVPAFFLDGKEVPGTEGAKNAWFSKDGKHYAVVCENASSRAQFMVIDGKKQNEYQSVSADEKTFWWTADGSQSIYTVTAGGRSFLVVNGEEVPITMLIGYDKIVLADSGSRYGYGTRDGSNRMHSLVVDGKDVLPAGARPYDNTLTFSPDGSRYAFFAGPAMRNEMNTLVVDGTVQEGVTPAYFANWASGALFAPSFAFSRDGQHLAHLGRLGGASNNSIIVDGKPVFSAARAVYSPAFTPDNQHFVWMADELHPRAGQGALTVVYVDGVEAVRANGYFFRSTPGSFTMNSEGLVTFFAADDEHVKRYRITPSSDTSIATMFAAAKAARERAEEDAVAAAEAVKRAEEEALAAAAAKAQADREAIEARRQAATEAAATRKAAAEAAAAARLKAAEDKRNARLLQLENAKRAKQGLPPLKELPASP